MTPGEIKQYRLQRGLTQSDLARQAGVAPNTVARWERGDLTISAASAAVLHSVMGSTAGEIVAVAGLRALHQDSLPEVELAIAREIGNGAHELRFGDAAGVDLHAAGAACDMACGSIHVRVYVLTGQLPRAQRALVARSGVTVEAVDRPRGRAASYSAQTAAMLHGAHRLLAFTDGRSNGGTHSAIRMAGRLGVPVAIVPVLSTDSARASANPQIMLEGALAPIHGVHAYVPRGAKRRPTTAWVTSALLALESGRAGAAALDSLADEAASYIRSHEDLAAPSAIVAVPGRDPAAANRLDQLANLIGERTRQIHLPGWLVRTHCPTGVSITLSNRTHFQAQAHADSMAVRGQQVQSLLILDDVIAYSGTMIGAQRAISRDAGLHAPGLALTYVTSLTP